MSSLVVAPRVIAAARAKASDARARTRSNVRVVARARAPIGQSLRGLGQAHRARARIVVDAAADAAADAPNEDPRFVPAHERTTLSKILPEQLLAGGGVETIFYGIFGIRVHGAAHARHAGIARVEHRSTDFYRG
jgi:hypothetical protein